MRKAVLYSTDDGYADVTGISILSLSINNQETDFDIHIIDTGISKINREKLRLTAEQYGNACYFYNAEKELKPFKELKRTIHYGTFARIVACRVLPQDISYILYIDADTLIVGNIAPIYNINLENKLLVGVYDAFLPAQGRMGINFSREELYINAGVLYINLNQWRKQNIDAQCLNFLLQHPKVSFHDQDAINCVCKGKIGLMSMKYNIIGLSMMLPYRYSKKIMDKAHDLYCSEENYIEALNSPSIIHFAGSFLGKPWNENCNNPFKKQFDYFKKISCWSDSKLRTRKYAQNKYIGFYKKYVEKVCIYAYQKENYKLFFFVYRYLYDLPHKFLALLRQ